MNKNILLSAVFCALTLAGCGKGEKGSIKILTMSPEPTVALKVGQKVDLKIEVEYTLTKKEGRVGIYVHPEGGLPSIATGTKDVNVKKGTGKTEITGSFTVPEAPQVRVSVMLLEGAYSKRTEVVTSRTYNVMQNKK